MSHSPTLPSEGTKEGIRENPGGEKGQNPRGHTRLKREREGKVAGKEIRPRRMKNIKGEQLNIR